MYASKFYWNTKRKITYLSAPAHDNILLILLTWKGRSRTRKWKASFPQFLTRYLLAQIRPASRASDESCSYSSEIIWIHRGKSSTRAFFLPRSKILILGSEGKEIKSSYTSTKKMNNLVTSKFPTFLTRLVFLIRDTIFPLFPLKAFCLVGL